LPGTDPVEAAKTVFGELPDLPHAPELPERGPGADMLGRTAALLVDLPVELYAGSWRLASRSGVDRRRALDMWERDLDAMAEVAADYSGPVKLQVCGVWTLAAGLELANGSRVLRDPGACRDLADSLAEGIKGYLADMRGRLPEAELLLQVDEPSLPAVLAGTVRTESGLYTYPPVEEQRVVEVLRSVVDAAGTGVVFHCCAPHPPVGLFRDAGATAVSIDLTLLENAESAELDALGEVVDAGVGLFAGVVPSRPVRGALAAPTIPEPSPEARPMSATGSTSTAARAAADAVMGSWRRLGFPAERAAAQVVVTPTCGLAGADPHYARRAMAVCVEAGHRLADTS